MGTVFWLIRKEDTTGVSGTGVVAEGIIFESGQVAMEWREGLAGVASLGIYPNIEAVMKIHGHDGKTVVQREQL